MPQPIELFKPLQIERAGKQQNADDQAMPTYPNWKKELADATTSAAKLLKRLKLEHALTDADIQPDFKCLATRSFISKMQIGDINDPLLLQVLPLQIENESLTQHSGLLDPVGDINAMASPGLLHKYHGRSLLISTAACAVHCRYCFRRHYPYRQSACSSSALQETLNYLKKNNEIEEIILSGGDPLVLDNKKLAQLIKNLETIPHLKTLRIHSRLPVVLPERIDTGLIHLLQQTRFKVVLVTHINHANEIQAVEMDKCLQLHDAGITLFNQSVLLKGINDSTDTLVSLSKRLFDCKIVPYYLHLLDPVKGAMHFSMAEKIALQLHEKMEQKLPGYLVPKLVREIAGNKSKTAIFRI